MNWLTERLKFQYRRIHMKKFRAILITGVSNGIGKALANNLAGPGIFIAISGRK